MRRSQRSRHRLIWFILAPVLVALLVWAIASRGEFDVRRLPAAVEGR